jgi:hypothetical protein
MRLTVFAAILAFILWGTPAFAGTAPDADGDGIGDAIDNCSDRYNTDQDDTDVDDCGNLCDADYENSGKAGFADFAQFLGAFGGSDAEKCHVEPILPCAVGFDDFAFFLGAFNTIPGPSSTTSGSTACPL